MSANSVLRNSLRIVARGRVCQKRTFHNGRFTENDIVLLRAKEDPDARPVLTKPLKPSSEINSHRGRLSHADIIGKRVRDVVKSHNGRQWRIHLPTLAEYVTLSKRIVTPVRSMKVYPADANVIISLLDLNIDLPAGEGGEQGPSIEILEAGTGHGGLTLHLARAVHGANTRPPESPSTRALDESDVRSPPAQSETDGNSFDGEAAKHSRFRPDCQHEYEEWRMRRRAIVHTLDISAKHSEHARSVVRNFRQGLYTSTIDFHVGDVTEWINSQLEFRGSQDPFLAHILLDLPSAHNHLVTVSKALQVDGVLTVFNPSITQIAKCVESIRTLKLPLVIDQVIELGQSSGTGKQWDVRAARPREFLKAARARQKEISEEGDRDDHASGGASTAQEQQSRDEEQGAASPPNEMDDDQGWEMVCRPKVGQMLAGGGFLGVWRRMRHVPADEN